MQSKIQMFFSLLRSAVVGDPMSEDEKAACLTEWLPDMMSIAKKHDLAHLLSVAFRINGFNAGDLSNNTSEIQAVYRIAQQSYALEKLTKALEKAKIPFIPLKGSVIRQYYREEWLRTSCDIDVLVHESDVEQATNVLIGDCGCTVDGKGSHDVSLFSPGKVHIELHYDLVEDGRANKSREVLNEVWEHSKPHDNFNYWHEMSDEMFYFYHIAHMAKHFEIGGCGIRPFIDLWILDNIELKNQLKRDELLRRGDLYTFAEVARSLYKVWFEGNEHTQITKQMEEYILCGGVYGSIDNRVLVQQRKKGGRLKYALSRIFIPYKSIKFVYPILQKHRWLTPFMEVYRWFNILFDGRAKKAMHEFSYNKNVSNDNAIKIQEFLNDIGL